MVKKNESEVFNALPEVRRLYDDLVKIIETTKAKVGRRVNSEFIYMAWQLGTRINKDTLGNERAEYGKQIVKTMSTQLQMQYGNSFSERNLRWMLQFANQFKDGKIVKAMSSQCLSWSHVVELLPLPMDAKVYYINEVHNGMLTLRELRNRIDRKAYERREIANTQLTEQASFPFNAFKDPLLLDTFGLKDNFLEADLEKALAHDIGNFILEFGHGFSLVGRQKRIVVDDEFLHIDLLFFHIEMNRYVVFELKLGEFKSAHKGQMEIYLKWVEQNLMREGQGRPIGIILCSKKKNQRIEMLELDKAGIVVAEYWPKMLPKKEFEEKIEQLLAEAQERLERRKLLADKPTAPRQIEYFYESDEED